MWTATPTTLKTYHVDSTNETFFSQVRNVVTIQTNGIVGVLPYNAGGTFEPIVQLEIGDHFGISPDMDEYITCNGDSWNGKVFKIIGYELGIGEIQLKGIEV